MPRLHVVLYRMCQGHCYESVSKHCWQSLCGLIGLPCQHAAFMLGHVRCCVRIGMYRLVAIRVRGVVMQCSSRAAACVHA